MPLLQARSIVKSYPGVLALDRVDFTAEAGKIHCLVGENGAGKSTLMNILSGATAADSGEILVDGTAALFSSPRDARRQGIAAIHQDLKLVPDLTVAENIFLGHQPVRRRSGFIDQATMIRKSRELMESLGASVEVTRTVRTLSHAQRQFVAVAKAISQNVRALILDEPTAPLTAGEAGTLFDLLRRLKQEGKAIVYISHRLDEIFSIGDQVSVLRDGRMVARSALRATDKATLIRWMVGRDLSEEYPSSQRVLGRELLRLEHVSSGWIRNINLRLFRGEILGIAGLAGAGRTELARIIFGADPCESGTMYMDEREYLPRSPQDAIRRGIGFLPEDRNRYGLIMPMEVRKNISLAHLKGVTRNGLLSPRKERAVAAEYAELLSIRPGNVEASIEALSGGNRQKVLVARWLFTDSQLLMFDEPTAGIDVGARFELYQLIHRQAAEGRGIILISSDLPELLGMCDRIAVMCEGTIAGIVEGTHATQESIMTLASPGASRRAHAG
jgi:ribose transport system ATP-binding protein